MGYGKMSDSEMNKMVLEIKNRRKRTQAMIISMRKNLKGQEVMDKVLNMSRN